MKKYGLQLRAPPSQQRQNPTRPPLPPPLPGFRDDNDDDVEAEIARHASKNKALKDIEEQHKKALEEDPSVFDYDGVYDEMKEKIVKPIAKDKQERKSKYIERLMKKAKEREREHEVVYERKIAKERSIDDHLFADKEKFVTSAYKKKLAEQAQWLEEERLRQLREEKEDVTKKSDLSDFYFNLTKNEAFGGSKKPTTSKNAVTTEPDEDLKPHAIPAVPTDHSEVNSLKDDSDHHDKEDTSTSPQKNLESSDSKPASAAREKKLEAENPAVAEQTQNHHKVSEDALSAARERYLARKRAKIEQRLG